MQIYGELSLDNCKNRCILLVKFRTSCWEKEYRITLLIHYNLVTLSLLMLT